MEEPLGSDFDWFELKMGPGPSLTGLWGAERASWMSGEQAPLQLPEAELQSTSSMLTAASSLRLVRAWLSEAGAELLCGVTGLSTVGAAEGGAGLSSSCRSFMAGL